MLELRDPVVDTASDNIDLKLIHRTLSTGVKRQEHKADHTHPASAEVKKTRIYTSISPYVFMA
jgi:hypothetical protein